MLLGLKRENHSTPLLHDSTKLLHLGGRNSQHPQAITQAARENNTYLLCLSILLFIRPPCFAFFSFSFVFAWLELLSELGEFFFEEGRNEGLFVKGVVSFVSNVLFVQFSFVSVHHDKEEIRKLNSQRSRIGLGTLKNFRVAASSSASAFVCCRPKSGSMAPCRRVRRKSS